MHSPGFTDEWQAMEERVILTAAARAALEETQLRDELTRRMLRQWDVRLGELRRRAFRR